MWNPRYVAYAWAHGNTPTLQLYLDCGLMFRFIAWNTQRLAEFRKVSPGSFIDYALYDHLAYDAWLFGTVPCFDQPASCP